MLILHRRGSRLWVLVVVLLGWLLSPAEAAAQTFGRITLKPGQPGAARAIDKDAQQCFELRNSKQRVDPARYQAQLATCAGLAEVDAYCTAPLTKKGKPPAPAEIRAIVATLSRATRATEADKLCPSADAREDARLAPIAGLSGLGSLAWQDDVLRGAAAFVGARLQAELALTLEIHLRDQLCASADAKSMLPSACLLVSANTAGKTAKPAWGVLKAALERDLRLLPERFIEFELRKYASPEASEALRVVLSVVREIEEGKDALQVLAGLQATFQAEPNACAQMDVKCTFIVLGYAVQIVQPAADAHAGPDDPKHYGELAIRTLLEANPQLEKVLGLKLTDAADVERRGAAMVQIGNQLRTLKDLLDRAAKDPNQDTDKYLREFSAYIRAIIPVFKAAMVVATGEEPAQHTCAAEAKPAQCAALVVELTSGTVDLIEAVRAKDYSGALVASVSLADKAGVTAKLPVWVNTYLPFVVELASAKDSDSVQRVIESAAAPVGSYQQKRGSRDHNFTLTVTALAGAQGGGEVVVSTQLPKTAPVGRAGLFAPVGLDLSWGVGEASSVGLFVSLIDIGALVDFRTTTTETGAGTDKTKINPEPQVGFAQVVSPGAYLTYGISGTPLVLGGGVAFAPGLRKTINETTAQESGVSTLRFGGFLAVDISIFPIVR